MSGRHGRVVVWVTWRWSNRDGVSRGEVEVSPVMGVADRICLTGLRVFAHHGVFATEREAGQEFVIDVVVSVDLRAAASRDDLTQTVHYGELAEAVVAAVERDPVDLIETVAERVAAVALSFPPVINTTVTVHKPHAPITVPFADVAVTIVRTRGAPPRWFGPLLLLAQILETVTQQSPRRCERWRMPHRLSSSESRPSTKPPRPPLSADALLDLLHRVETDHGRQRSTRWASRTLDLDLIDFDGQQRTDVRLSLPHPRAWQRAFVLQPWLDLEPGATLVGYGSVATLRAAATDSVVRVGAVV